MLDTIPILIVEDGDEYLENLSRFVPGPEYLQAHSGGEALSILGEREVRLVYLDMRFDRIAHGALCGDHEATCREHGGDAARAWIFLQNNQGLFILDALGRAGHGQLPVILAYDFSREKKRLERLQKIYPRMAWVADAVTPDEIRSLMLQLLSADP